jgi:hypothetical protein
LRGRHQFARGRQGIVRPSVQIRTMVLLAATEYTSSVPTPARESDVHVRSRICN